MRILACLPIAAFISLSSLTALPPAYGQGSAVTLEEIVVTARKREENLQEVPVSISVISADLILEAGIINPRDIFESVPGLDYDEMHDRASSTPAIRGIQSSAVSVLKQKVTTFIDGLPIIGSQGTLQLTGVERVEVFRGPQSAAFGRATFGGAINYVTRDPGDEFEGDVRLDTSDLGRNSLEVLLAGPISDTLGYTLNMKVGEYGAPDDWRSTEGFGLHGSTTEYLDGKLKFTPSDSFDAEITFSHLVTDDENPLEVNISPEAYAACTNFASPNLVGVNWIKGNFDCDVSLPEGGNPTNFNTALAYAGTSDELLARAFSISDPGTFTERNRIQGEFNFGLANDTTIQVLGFALEEQKDWWNDTDRSDVPVNIANGMLAMGMQPVTHMASPADTTEQMVEVRWLSPDDRRLRWMVGASRYQYDVHNVVWSQYDAIVNGYTDDLVSQYGFTVSPNVTHVEDSKNVGVFGSINYDISDSTTFSFEGRWQNEELTNKNPITFDFFTNSTDKFLPRIAITHTIDDNVTLYGQISKGNNPAGVIPAAASPRIIESHAQATALGLIGWSLDSVLLYEEEAITNYEFGVKATLADNRVTLASTVYTMDWENYNQAFTLNWNINTLWEQSGNAGPSPGLIGGFGAGDYMLRAQLNAGDASVLGWENEVLWQARDNWTFGGTLTWQDTEYVDFCSPSAVSDIGLTPTNLITDGSGVPFNCVNVAGNSLTRQPDLKYTLNGTYRAPLGNTGWRWVARVDWRSIGEQYLDDMNFMSTPVTETLNASVNFMNDNWNLRVWSRNLTDDDTPIRISEGTDWNTPLTSSFWFIPRDPRELGVQATYSF